MKLVWGLLGVAVVLIVLATVFPIVWPMVTETTTDIDAMNGTDAGTTTFQGFWPIILLVVGLGVAVGAIMYGIKKFNISGGIGGLGI